MQQTSTRADFLLSYGTATNRTRQGYRAYVYNFYSSLLMSLLGFSENHKQREHRYISS